MDHPRDDPPIDAPEVDGYGSNPNVTELVNTTELWFVPVANPDGYDYTYTAPKVSGDNAKNLRDNNEDGQITGWRRRRPQPQLRLQVGLRQRGLLAATRPARPTAAPAPNSEPETKALDSLFKRVGFEFLINYHSAAELLLYGVGWQVGHPDPGRRRSTRRSPATTANPAIPGYDPEHLRRAVHHQRRGRRPHGQQLRYAWTVTPEMSTCQTASCPLTRTTSGSPRTARAVFNFPDDEKLIQA